MDRDTFTTDDFLAEGTFNLNECFVTGQQGAWVPLFREGQRAGEIEIQARFQGVMAPVMGAGIGMGYQQKVCSITINTVDANGRSIWNAAARIPTRTTILCKKC